MLYKYGYCMRQFFVFFFFKIKWGTFVQNSNMRYNPLSPTRLVCYLPSHIQRAFVELLNIIHTDHCHSNDHGKRSCDSRNMQITLMILQLKTDNAIFFSSPFTFAETVRGNISSIDFYIRFAVPS